MRGPPPKPTHLRVLQGNPSKRPLNRNEPQVPPVETVNPPDYLLGHARAEWDRVAPGLRAASLLTELDVTTLAMYCIAYGRWREAKEMLAEMREKDPVTRGLLINGKINPLTKIARNAAQDMLHIAGAFGMTPSARTRISLGVGYVLDDKFAGLLDDPGGGDRAG
jgi:P27 family predicted phage terminase small subunit